MLTEIKGQTASTTFDLFAVGGPVRWTIHLPVTAITTVLTVTPSSGYLKAGGSWVVVKVSIKSPISLTTHLVANPGGLIITIVLTVKL